LTSSIIFPHISQTPALHEFHRHEVAAHHEVVYRCNHPAAASSDLCCCIYWTGCPCTVPFPTQSPHTSLVSAGMAELVVGLVYGTLAHSTLACPVWREPEFMAHGNSCISGIGCHQGYRRRVHPGHIICTRHHYLGHGQVLMRRFRANASTLNAGMGQRQRWHLLGSHTQCLVRTPYAQEQSWQTPLRCFKHSMYIMFTMIAVPCQTYDVQQRLPDQRSLCLAHSEQRLSTE
jgi:hypothetical protein